MPRERLPIQPQAGLQIEEFDVEVRDEAKIRVRSYRKSSNKDNALPLIVYMHGGGYVFGGLETDDLSCRAIADQIDALVLSIEYRLAPEHQFPVGFQDCHDVVKWVSVLFGV